jgi:thioester reductase-like protein
MDAQSVAADGDRRTVSVMDRLRTDAILLTGATGFVGAAVLTRLLDQTDRPIVALVRARDREDADRRLHATLLELYPPEAAAAHAARCTAVPADLLTDGLGLDTTEALRIARRCDEIIHCAAAVSFDQELADARAVNRDGAGRIADLACAAMVRGDGLRRVVHVSTAYTAGLWTGAYGEADVPGGAFRNTYEQTKHEAEALLRDWCPGLPLQIVRPSIVVGDRTTGWTRSFNVLYWPMRMFAQGKLPVIPALADSPVDVVPVDYVADTIVGLAGAPAGTYHAVAGEHASTVREVVDLAAAHFGRSAPALVSPALLEQATGAALTDSQQRALDRARVFFPYFALGVHFDDRATRAVLEPLGVRTQPLADYFGTLMTFAEAASWGRPEVPAAAA